MVSVNNSASTWNTRPTIAVIDDDPAVCASLKFSLELEGFCVRTYASGLEFLQAGDLFCDCYVVDQRMPVMTGCHLIAAMREQEIFTPAILIISHPNDAIDAQAKKAGVPIVEKPLLGNALTERIREACGLKSSEAAR